MANTGRERWQWQTMIMQPDPISADIVAAALAQARLKKPSPGLNRLCYQHWAEGLCAQLLHIGPTPAKDPRSPGCTGRSLLPGTAPAAVTARSASATGAAAHHRNCALSSGSRTNPSPR